MKKRLVELRKKHNKTQSEIADILGVHRTTYANYEQGTREMDYDLLLKLADYYKVSLDYIFGRTDLPFHIDSYTEDEIQFMMRSLDLYLKHKQKFFS
ncbi:helix-turn-helix transcriptional regulator [Halalkalibacterium halodurans]|uniref:helix-turn-helix domain-containing protein n=1 Tax=Halalkalibacterium halodurans TaxID=86665 RepID=UPI002E226328|nr:helix-turn-helix transcriptional regulator [Halalkalibacterium halodurans]